MSQSPSAHYTDHSLSEAAGPVDDRVAGISPEKRSPPQPLDTAASAAADEDTAEENSDHVAQQYLVDFFKRHQIESTSNAGTGVAAGPAGPGGVAAFLVAAFAGRRYVCLSRNLQSIQPCRTDSELHETRATANDSDQPA